MSGRTYSEGEPMRNKVTGHRGEVVLCSGDVDRIPFMVIQCGDEQITTLGEDTWEWESLLGPG